MLSNQLIQDTIEKYNMPELAKENGMVYQVWEDGEVTLQKSGDLLWQRNLHLIKSGCAAKAIHPSKMPEQNRSGTHGWMFTDEEGTAAFRMALGMNPDW